MIAPELTREADRIQISTSRLVDELLSGQYHSAFKGRGIEFEEVRPYQPGDDVRTIDWNVTARYGTPHIKLFREERELTVYLAVDMSPSQFTGTHRQLKRDLIVQLCATLAFSAVKNNDNVALISFTDRLESLVAPGKGPSRVYRIVRELLQFQPRSQATNIDVGLQRLLLPSHRRGLVFLISDFQDDGYDRALSAAARRHDLVPIIVSDPVEQQVPNVGLVHLQDAETGHTTLVDTSSRTVRSQYARQADESARRRNRLFDSLELQALKLQTGEDFVPALREFFRAREHRA